MNCDCGEKCFSYQKFNSNGDKRIIILVNKCARISSPKAFSIIGAKPNLKKKKCSFYSETELESRVVPEKKAVKPVLFKGRINNHHNELMKNISLYKNCIENGLNFKKYLARIDYHLDALNYTNFNYNSETVLELIERISRGADKMEIEKKSNFEVIISHELLPSIKKKKVPIKRTLQKKKTIVEKTSDYFEKLTKQESENKEEVVKCKIIDEDCEECEECEETELNDHLEEEEEELEETYEYVEDSGGDDDDPGDFSD